MNPFSTSYPSDASDTTLIERILDGDRAALNNLISRHQPFIFNLAWKMIGDPIKAQDLTQEALLKIISNLGSFRAESSFRTWCFRIVRNHFLNDQKKPQASLRKTSRTWVNGWIRQKVLT
ncbi:MAG: sigma-70 family RNA polymerase sigma factor [Bacteroidota bacterium]